MLFLLVHVVEALVELRVKVNFIGFNVERPVRLFELFALFRWVCALDFDLVGQRVQFVV